MRGLVVIAILLAACGGGTGGQAPSAPTAATGASETAAPPAAGATAPGAASAAPTADAGPSFADLVRSGKLASYKISYKMTSTDGGQSGTVEQTWYFKPPKTRLDFAAPGADGKVGRVSMFFLENGSFLCTVDDSQKVCLQVSTEAAEGQNLGFEIQDSFQDDPAAFNATLKETRTIAGQQAFCYVVRGAAAVIFTEGTFCYTRTGIPLLLQWAGGGGSFTMEATAFSTSVPDADFTLPAPPTKLP